jgi:hypothetical protein
MRELLLVLVLVVACGAGGAAEPADVLLAQVADAIRSESTVELERVKVRAVEATNDLYVAICDTQREWWGEFRCLQYRAGKVTWTASYADESAAPTEQSIRSARGFRLPDFEGALVEVFGTTHMGNGNYYLYELRAKKLHLLVTTVAVDSHDDGRVIRGGALKAEYHDVNADGRVDIILSGTIDYYGDRDALNGPPRRSSRCRKVLLWDRSKGRFVEDVAGRIGFAPGGR